LCISTGIIFIASSIFCAIYQTKRAIKKLLSVRQGIHKLLYLLSQLPDKNTTTKISGVYLQGHHDHSILHLLRHLKTISEAGHSQTSSIFCLIYQKKIPKKRSDYVSAQA
jgi:hypothetical protein